MQQVCFKNISTVLYTFVSFFELLEAMLLERQFSTDIQAIIY